MELSYKGPDLWVTQRVVNHYQVTQGLLDPFAGSMFQFQILLLCRRLGLNPPTHRATYP